MIPKQQTVTNVHIQILLSRLKSLTADGMKDFA